MKYWLLILVLFTSVYPEWSDNPANPVFLGSGIQPQIASTSDGGAYVAWLSDGNFHIYLQHLDASGNPQWSPGAMIVSNQPNSSWIAVYHLNLVVDAQDNAIITSVDTRSGNWEVYAYKIDSNGTQLWGADGLALSSSGADNISPRLVVDPLDNSVIVSWSDNYTSLKLQRINQEGQVQWGDLGISVSSLGASLISPIPVINSEGDILIQAVRQTGNFPALSSQLVVQKYSSSGAAQWQSWTRIGEAVSFPLGNWLQDIAPDLQGGAYSSWTQLTTQNQTGMTQRVRANGDEVWGAPLELSTAAENFRISPRITAANDGTGVYAVWGESDANQINRGIFAQRVDSSSTQLWGATGSAIEGLSDQVYSDIVVESWTDDLIACYIRQNNRGSQNVIASRIQPDASFAWDSNLIHVTTSGSEKSDLDIARGPNQLFLVWSQAGSIEAHCLLQDGSLGIATPHTAGIIEVPEDFSTIQAAIDASLNGDTILVQPGTYSENINFSGKDIVVGSLVLTTGDRSYMAQTIIDGGRAGTVVTFNSSETPAAELVGFIIQNGEASLSDPDGDGSSSSYGGGIYCQSASPTLKHLVVSNNIARGGGGGGLFCYDASPSISEVSFVDNISEDVGGGIYARLNCTLNIENSTFLANSCPSVGAAVYARDNSTINMNRSLIVENISNHAGGGIGLKAGCQSLLTNVTISNNFALHHGAGLYSNSSSYTVINSILWDNEGGEVYFANFDDPSQISLAYSTIQDSSGGITTNDNGAVTWFEGNIDQNPLFENMDYSLTMNSPCLDAGVDVFVIAGDTLLDIPGTEIVGSGPDMGVFELTPEIVDYFPLAVNSGWVLASDIDTVEILIGASMMIEGNQYYKFHEEYPFYPYESFDLFRVEGNQVKVWTGTSDAILYDIAVPLNTSWEFQPGGEWNAQITLISVGDTIETPLGTYENCYCFHRYIGADYEYYDWLAEDGGLVQRDVVTFAGPRRYTLISNLVTVGVEDEQTSVIPQELQLRQNFPNPFNPNTTIRYGLAEASQISLVVYDVSGAEVMSLHQGPQKAGWYSHDWSGIDQYGSAIPAGVYLCRVEARGFSQTIKMLYLK